MKIREFILPLAIISLALAAGACATHSSTAAKPTTAATATPVAPANPPSTTTPPTNAAPALAAAVTTTNANELAYQAFVKTLNADIQSGKDSEGALSNDLAQLDALRAAENGQPTELGAKILYLKATIYAQALEDPVKAKSIFLEVKKDYPNTKRAAQVDHIVALMDKEVVAKKIQATLVVGAKFPDFSETNLDGEPISVAKYQGKVVLVDFWATWCGPCRGELPNVIATYGKYHDKGFEIIGVSLDDDKDKLTKFIQDNKMTWSMYFDGKGWENKLAGQYGIMSIPATFLIDPQGKIIGRDLRGEDLTKAVANALGGLVSAK